MSAAASQAPEFGEIPVSELSGMAAGYNPRKISEHDKAALRRSLRFFGPVEPIVVNRRTQRIVGGHQRVVAAEAEGIDSLPVAWVDLDEPSEKQLNLALNRISGEWDEEKLADLLRGLGESGADLELTGFDASELKGWLDGGLADGNTDADALPEAVPERCAPGDLWQLGSHRLLCGDSTNADDTTRLFDGAAPMLTITDPPYGVNYDPSWRNEKAEKGQLAYSARRGLLPGCRLFEVQPHTRAVRQAAQRVQRRW